MHCALSYAKQQKIFALQKQNYDLTNQIEKLLKFNEKENKQMKINNAQLKNIQTQIQVQEVKKTLLKSSLASMGGQQQNLIELLKQSFESLQQAQKTNRSLNKELHELNKQKQQHDIMLQRLKKELKVFQNIANSNCNIIKTSNSIKKTNQCLIRTLNVLKNKLESHKKYLSILQKKQDKEQKQKEKFERIKSCNIVNYKSNSAINIKNPLKNQRINEQLQKNNEKQKVVKKIKAKQYDELTRKKNNILINSKK